MADGLHLCAGCGRQVEADFVLCEKCAGLEKGEVNER